MVYIGCTGRQTLPIDYLFNYQNLNFTSGSNAVVTNVDYTVANLGGKRWRLEFKLHPYTQATHGSEYCFMQGGTYRGQEWYIKRSVINYWDNNWNGAISESNPNDNDEWVIEFIPNPGQTTGLGTINTYRNGVLDKTSLNKNIGLLPLESSSNTKIVLGEYQGSQYHFIGTFEYIRMYIVDEPVDITKINIITTSTSGSDASVKVSQYFNQTLVSEQTLLYTDYRGESNAYTCDPVKVYYNQDMYMWFVIATAPCTYNGINYNAGRTILNWQYNTEVNLEIIKN